MSLKDQATFHNQYSHEFVAAWADQGVFIPFALWALV